MNQRESDAALLIGCLIVFFYCAVIAVLLGVAAELLHLAGVL